MSNSKIQALLDQKAKLDQQIKIETDKRLNHIGRMAKAEHRLMKHFKNYLKKLLS